MPAGLKCGSEKVIQGRMVCSARMQRPVFRPKSLRFFSFLFSGGVLASDKSFACLDCGLIWSSAAPDELRTFVKKHCKQA